jgi:hypothetical protein
MMMTFVIWLPAGSCSRSSMAARARRTALLTAITSAWGLV